MVKERILEGGAMEDDDGISMEEYSEIMKKKLGSEYMRFVKKILSEVNPPLNGRILEIGPGPGWVGIWLVKERKDLTLIGLEPSKDMRKVAKKNAEYEEVASKITYTDGYVEDLSKFEDEEFDLVISRDSLHHWEDPFKGFMEIKRVLKKLGKLLITDNRRDMNFGGKMIVNLFGPILAGKMLKYWKSSIAAAYTPNEINDLLKKADINNWIIKTDMMDLNICFNNEGNIKLKNIVK